LKRAIVFDAGIEIPPSVMYQLSFSLGLIASYTCSWWSVTFISLPFH
jgi:hypothetical protein